MEPIKAEFKLESVSVFQSSAMFNLVGVAKCKAGENVIVAGKLTRMLDKSSVRVKGKGPGRIANIIIEKQYTEQVDKEKIKEMREKILELEKIKRKKEDDLTSAQKLKQEKLEAMKSFSTEYPKWYSKGRIDLKGVKDLETLFKEQVAEYSKEIRKLGYEIEDLQNQLEELQRKISDLGYSGHREVNAYYDVTVVIDAKEAKEFTVEINVNLVFERGKSPMYHGKMSLRLAKEAPRKIHGNRQKFASLFSSDRMYEILHSKLKYELGGYAPFFVYAQDFKVFYGGAWINGAQNILFK